MTTRTKTIKKTKQNHPTHSEGGRRLRSSRYPHENTVSTVWTLFVVSLPPHILVSLTARSRRSSLHRCATRTKNTDKHNREGGERSKKNKTWRGDPALFSANRRLLQRGRGYREMVKENVDAAVARSRAKTQRQRELGVGEDPLAGGWSILERATVFDEMF